MTLRDPNFSATYTVDDIRVYTGDTVTWTLTVTNTSDAQILVDYDLRHPRQLGKESTVDAAGTYGYTGDGSHNGTTDRITLPAAGQGVLTFQYTITETADNVPLTSVAELTEVVGSTIDSQGNTITQSDPTLSVKAPTVYLNRWGGGKTSEAVDPRQAWSSWVFGTDVTAARISDAIAEGKDWLEVLAEVIADEGGGGGAGVDLAGSPPPSPTAGDLWVNDTSGVMFYYTGDEWVEITATSSGGLSDIVEDLTPQLGGPLDANGQTIDGRNVATDGAKLDGIEAGATADQTAADIRALGFFDTTNDGTGSGLDADTVDGIEAAALLQNVAEDTTPQLGGPLDVNGNEITGAIDLHSTGDVVLELGDAVGTNKVSVRDNAGIEQAAVDSDGNITTNGTVDGRDVAADGTKLDGIEAGADVTDTANVTAAGALMDSEVDADLKTLALPANTTISAFGATLVDDADAATARTTLGVDAAGTDNSTDVTLAGTPDYLTIAGQVITRNQIDLTADVTGDLPLSNLAQASATARVLGRNTAGAGDWEEVTEAQLKALFSLQDVDITDTNSLITATTVNGAFEEIFRGQYAVNTTNVATTYTIPAQPYHRLTMTANTTFSFTSPTASACTMMVRVAGAFTPTWPASVDWHGGTAGTYDAPTLYTFTTTDGGTNWDGVVQAGGLA